MVPAVLQQSFLLSAQLSALLLVTAVVARPQTRAVVGARTPLVEAVTLTALETAPALAHPTLTAPTSLLASIRLPIATHALVSVARAVIARAKILASMAVVPVPLAPELTFKLLATALVLLPHASETPIAIPALLTLPAVTGARDRVATSVYQLLRLAPLAISISADAAVSPVPVSTILTAAAARLTLAQDQLANGAAPTHPPATLSVTSSALRIVV